MRWSIQSLEWGAPIARVFAQQQQLGLVPPLTHFVLPDLSEEIISSSTRSEFFHSTVQEQRIQTIAACKHSSKTCLLTVNVSSVDTVLVVGGNDKGRQDGNNLTTVEAIRILAGQRTSKGVASSYKNNDNLRIWAVANPNDPKSVDDIHQKLDAGASGIIIQPLLSSKARSILERYPKGDDDEKVLYVAGVAFPQTPQSLLFWLQLLQQPELEHDSLVQDHLKFLENMSREKGPEQRRESWAKTQLEMLSDISLLSGVHYMPLGNTKEWLSIVQAHGQI
jgi:5,10-methylenetetrahydrofolate reductase